jgi:hypothetical protein
MDRTYIDSQQIVARYLSGDLTVREARQFEKYCLENPEWVKSQPIPVRLKAKMIRKPGEELEGADLENMPTNASIEAAARGFGALDTKAQRWVKMLSVLLVLAVAGIVGAMFYADSLNQQLKALQKTTKDFGLSAPGSTREVRIKPVEAQPSGPTVNIGWPNRSELLDMRVDMAEGGYNSFLITITSLSEGHIMQIRRVARDSNGEVRFNLNSSAFGPGEYDLKFDGYTWRGDTVPVGWVRLGLK